MPAHPGQLPVRPVQIQNALDKNFPYRFRSDLVRGSVLPAASFCLSRSGNRRNQPGTIQDHGEKTLLWNLNSQCCTCARDRVNALVALWICWHVAGLQIGVGDRAGLLPHMVLEIPVGFQKQPQCEISRFLPLVQRGTCGFTARDCRVGRTETDVATSCNLENCSG